MRNYKGFDIPDCDELTEQYKTKVKSWAYKDITPQVIKDEIKEGKMINNFELTRDFCGSILNLCEKNNTTFIGKPNEESYWKVHYFPEALNMFVINNSSPEDANILRQNLVAEWLELLENKTIAINYVNLIRLFLDDDTDLGDIVNALDDFINKLSKLMYKEFNNGKLDEEVKDILRTLTHRFLRESMNPENSWNVRELMTMCSKMFTTGEC